MGSMVWTMFCEIVGCIVWVIWLRRAMVEVGRCQAGDGQARGTAPTMESSVCDIGYFSTCVLIVKKENSGRMKDEALITARMKDEWVEKI